MAGTERNDMKKVGSRWSAHEPIQISDVPKFLFDKPFLNPVSALSFRPKFPEMLVHSFNVVGDAGRNAWGLRFSY